MGKVRNSLVGQVMCFIKDVQAVTRVRQNGTAAKREVSQYQIVVGNNDIDFLHPFTRLVKHALLEVAAAAVAALNVVGGQS